jgi:hypothetical protein
VVHPKYNSHKDHPQTHRQASSASQQQSREEQASPPPPPPPPTTTTKQLCLRNMVIAKGKLQYLPEQPGI